jgi:flagellar basal body-associated protein FliL
MIIQILILIGVAVVGGLLYGIMMTQIDLYQSKKEAKKREEYWKRYEEYMMKARKARERDKIK